MNFKHTRIKKSVTRPIACIAILYFLFGNGELFAQYDYSVNAPYTSPARNTCGTGNDCTLQSSDEHIYRVNIPSNANWTFSLCSGTSYDSWIEVGTTICGDDVGSNDDFCALQSEVTATIAAGIYYVSIEGYGTDCGDYILDISGPVPNDAGVIAVIAPTSSCVLTSTENVTVSVYNFGTNSQSNIPVSYRVNGGAVISESIAGPIAAGSTASYTFTSTANLSTTATYNFEAWTSLASDANSSNDSSANYQVITGSVVENVCIADFTDTSGTFNYNCNFTNDLCTDGYSYGKMTLNTSLPIAINAQDIDSITFYLYYTDCGFGTDFIFNLNGVQIGTFTDMLGECTCFPSTYPSIYSITDSAMLNALWSDTNTLGVIHNGSSMAVAGYRASIYARCSPPSFIEASGSINLCMGDSALLSVSVIDSTELIPPYTYFWSPSAGLSCDTCQSAYTTTTATVTYFILVTDSAGTQDSTVVTVTVYAGLQVVAGAGTSFICAGDAVQLNASANIGGASFSWIPATGLSCTNCPSPFASPASTTTFHVTATFGSCSGVDSVLISVGTGPIAPSCFPTTTGYCCGMGIHNVIFNAINNPTADGIEGYQDYSCSKATNVIVDLSYPISIQTGTSYEENVRVWIDYNNNGVFANDSTTELVFWSDNILTNHSGAIPISSSAVLNTPLRMRVASDFYVQPDPVPCNNVMYGQVEDYTIIILLPNTIPPVADFDFTLLDLCQGIVSFTDQSLYNPTSWFWDFGDGKGLSASKNPYYFYDLPGSYTATLIVTNPYGTDTFTRQVVINSIKVNFTVSSNAIAIGEFVSFYDNSTGAATWQWDFGDGFSATLQNPVHSYSSAGTYTVTLIVGNSSGCIAQMMMQIMVCSNKPQTEAIIGPVNADVSNTKNYSVPFNIGSIYTWIVTGGIQTSGNQTNFIGVLWTASGSGMVQVVESDSLGCTGDTVSLIVNVGGVGIEEIQDADFRLQIIPNPNSGKFILSVTNNGQGIKNSSAWFGSAHQPTLTTGYEVKIYNILGECIYNSFIRPVNSDETKSVINLSSQPAGIYHLQILTNLGTVHGKIVLESH